jgi:hypothetical protein
MVIGTFGPHNWNRCPTAAVTNIFQTILPRPKSLSPLNLAQADLAIMLRAINAVFIGGLTILVLYPQEVMAMSANE